MAIVLPQDIGDGLVLRRATSSDAEAIATFNARINEDENDPVGSVGAWVRDLMNGSHPTFPPGDFTLVEDTKTGAIVSSLNLIDQVWSYEGIPFKVGRPELVATDPNYRRRGLVRRQFEVIHQWGAERGQKVFAITGIPFYYRQFGYEMALSWFGTRMGYVPAHVPKLKQGSTEPYRLRPVSEADLTFLMELYDTSTKRYPVAVVWDEALWRYELFARTQHSVLHRTWHILESAEGERVGYLAHTSTLFGPTLFATAYELKSGVSWLAVTPTVLRHLAARGAEYAALANKEFAGFAFPLGSEHPVYEAAHDRLPRKREPYAWYIRIADLPDFIRHITPALDKRLAGSIAVGHTGELKISFYRDGLILRFEQGCLRQVEAWKPSHEDQGAAGFPGLTFLQLLFGFRSLEDLQGAFPDCWVDTDDARALLKALFPKKHSNIYPIG